MFPTLEPFVDYDKVRPPRPVSSPESPASKHSSKDKFIIEYFVDIEKHLLHKTIVGDGHAYSRCVKTTRRDVHAELEAEPQKLSPGEATLGQRKEFEQRVQLFNAADVVFKFFLHPDSLVPTVRKFWGAVEALVKVRQKNAFRGPQS